MLPVVKMLEMKDGELMAFLGRRSKRGAWMQIDRDLLQGKLVLGSFRVA